MSGADTVDLTKLIDSPDLLAQEIWTLYDEWKGYSLQARERWRETKRYVFATDTRDTQNSKNPWCNSTIRPKITHIHDNLLVNYEQSLFPNNDWLQFIGNDQEASSKETREVVEGYLKTKHRLSDFRNVTRELLQDWVLYGNAFCGVTYVNETHTDPVTGDPEPSYIGPRIYRISPYDIVFNAKATSFEKSPKIVRILKTQGELLRDAEENPELGYSTDVLRKLQEDRALILRHSDDDINRSISFSGDGYGTPSQYYRSGYVELREFYGDIYDSANDRWLKNYVITVADGRYLVRMEPLNTWTGRPHIYHVGWRELPDNIWAQGPLDNLVGMQYRINHLENARADAFDQMLDPDIVFQGDPEIEQVGAARYYYVSEAGNVRHLAPDSTVLNADFQIRELESLMELYAGAPREALGARTPGEKTAFEVQSLQNAASRTFEHKTALFSIFLEDVVNAEIEVSRRNLDDRDIIQITDNDFGADLFLQITRDQITANGRIIPVGARHSARQAQLIQNLQQFQASILADPEVAQHFSSLKLGEMAAELLNYDNTGLYRPYARISERADAQRRMQVAAQQVEEESIISAADDDEVVTDEMLFGTTPQSPTDPNQEPLNPVA